MISAGTGPSIWIDFGKDEPDMKLQMFESGKCVDYLKGGKEVLSSAKLDKLPAGRYHLVR